MIGSKFAFGGPGGNLVVGVDLNLRESDAAIYGWVKEEEDPVLPGALTDPGILFFPGHPTIELMRNPNFEAGDRDWTKNAGFTIEDDATNAYDGRFVGKHVGTANSSLRNSVFIAVQPGDVLMASCMIKRTAGDGVPKVRILWADSTKVDISATNGNAVTSSTYALSRVVGTAPALTFFAQVQAVSGAITVSQTAFFDQFQASFFPQGDLAELDQVDTPEVVDNAITIDDFFSNTGLILVGATEIEIGTVTVTTDGGVVEVIGSCKQQSGTMRNVTVRIRKDSVTGTILATGFTALDISPATIIGKDSSPATTQTYKLTGLQVTGGKSVEQRILLAKNRKK